MRAREFITEYKRQQTITTYGDRLLQHAAKNKETNNIDDIMAALEAMDPTRNKQYVVWLARQYLSGRFRLEDQSRIRDDLTAYDSLKPRLPQNQRDINQLTYPALIDIVDSVNSATIGDSGSEKSNTGTFPVVSDSTVLYNGPLGQLSIPKTQAASCELGRGTRWCTAADTDNWFDRYSQEGPLYVWRDRNGSKYQFHFESGQFKDSRDQDIKKKLLDQFRTTHPILSQLFAKREKDVLDSGDARAAYHYAHDILKAPWPEAEPQIAQDPDAAYWYARYVLKAPFPQAEPQIAQDPLVAYLYARYVLKAPWPEAEPQIAQDPDAAYRYARDLLKRPWPEAEPVIAQNPWGAYEYAQDVLRGQPWTNKG